MISDGLYVLSEWGNVKVTSFVLTWKKQSNLHTILNAVKVLVIKSPVGIWNLNMYKPQNYIEKPINVLSFDSFGHAILNQEGISIIESIQKPISILSIAGPYRTGKSFLLNSLISAQEKFTVSSTTRSCTKGLWIWGKPITSVDEEGRLTNILIIDTQGFGSCEQVYDKRIIILALLLSTCFIFNSKGLIDSDSLNDLQYVIQQTKKVKKQLCFDSATDFHWVLRDFHYQMVNQLNVKIEPDQYMERSLKQYSTSSQCHKQIYKMLCEFFRNRKCHTLITPETDPSIEQNPQFVQQLIKFKKILNGLPSLNLDGMTLAQIIQAYVSAMNENYTQSGVEREGAECRLRINCLSKLCRQLDAIREEQPQKRAKLTKHVLHEVENSVISKMTSEKQIRMLKEEMNVIISQFQEGTTAATAKNTKIRQSRNSFSLAKIKQHRVCAQLQQFSSQKDIRVTNKAQLSALQKVRQELQSKIHRCQLEIGQIYFENESLKSVNSGLEGEKLKLEQKVNQISEELRRKGKQIVFLQLQLEEKLEHSRKQHIETVSQLEKQNRLLEQKVAYFQQKMTSMEIFQLESQSELSSRYKQQIAYLEKENNELFRKHEDQLRELRIIYQRREEENEPMDSGRVRQKFGRQFSQQLKEYNDQICKLQEENSQLMIWKHQAEEKMSELESKYQQGRKTAQIEIENMEKKQKQRQSKVNELHINQISCKQKIIQELQVRVEQERRSKQEEVGIANSKYEQLHSEIVEIQLYFEAEMKELKEQCAQACEKYQLEQCVRKQKQKQMDRIAAELQVQRECASKSYHEHYQSTRKLREELLAAKLELEQTSAEKQQERQLKQQLEREMVREKQEYESYKKQLATLHQIEISRLEGKITTLTSANNLLKYINQKYDEVKCTLAQQQELKCALSHQLQMKQEHLKSSAASYSALKEENEKLEKIIDELTKSVNANSKELEHFAERNTLKLSEKEEKYLQILEKLHEKQKQCYLLAERNEFVRKQFESKEKSLQKSLAQRLQQKINEIVFISNNLALVSQKFQHSESQLSRLKNAYSLLQQRHLHLQQNYQIQVKDLKERSSREWQKTVLEVGKFELQIEKLRGEKEELSKMVTMLQNDGRETSLILIQMQKKHERNMEQYQSNIRMMRKRLVQLQHQNHLLKQKFQKTAKALNCVEKTKSILEQNYNQDFKLWASKIKVHQHQQLQSQRKAGHDVVLM